MAHSRGPDVRSSRPAVFVVDLLVDGVAELFELWSGGDRSRSAGRAGGVTVVIEAAGHPIADVALVRVRDLEPFIAERRK